MAQMNMHPYMPKCYIIHNKCHSNVSYAYLWYKLIKGDRKDSNAHTKRHLVDKQYQTELTIEVLPFDASTLCAIHHEIYSSLLPTCQHRKMQITKNT